MIEESCSLDSCVDDAFVGPASPFLGGGYLDHELVSHIGGPGLVQRVLSYFVQWGSIEAKKDC